MRAIQLVQKRLKKFLLLRKIMILKYFFKNNNKSHVHFFAKPVKNKIHSIFEILAIGGTLYSQKLCRLCSLDKFSGNFKKIHFFNMKNSL